MASSQNVKKEASDHSGSTSSGDEDAPVTPAAANNNEDDEEEDEDEEKRTEEREETPQTGDGKTRRKQGRKLTDEITNWILAFKREKDCAEGNPSEEWIALLHKYLLDQQQIDFELRRKRGKRIKLEDVRRWLTSYRTDWLSFPVKETSTSPPAAHSSSSQGSTGNSVRTGRALFRPPSKATPRTCRQIAILEDGQNESAGAMGTNDWLRLEEAVGKVLSAALPGALSAALPAVLEAKLPELLEVSLHGALQVSLQEVLEAALPQALNNALEKAKKESEKTEGESDTDSAN